jgi:hypothetical protein
MDQPWTGSGKEPSPDKKAGSFHERQQVTEDSLHLLATVGVTKTSLLLLFFSLPRGLGRVAHAKCGSNTIDLAHAHLQAEALLQGCLKG